MIISLIFLSVFVVGLVIATYSDLKIREVDNWLIIVMLIGAVGFATLNGMLLKGLIGSLLFGLIGILLYATKQWGGADAKIMFCLGFIFWPVFPMLFFFITFMFVNSIYSVVWLGWLSYKKKKLVIIPKQGLPFYPVFLMSFILYPFIQNIILQYIY